MAQLNFRDIRPWNSSQQSGFEELCCQLASSEDCPEGSRFIRKGTPDAGVECFWILPDETEWGWQAKHFFSVGDSQWQQLDNSVRNALDKHPNLLRYVICLPINRPDARIEGRKSLMDRWNEWVEKWQQWAADRGMTVEFDYWGEHELIGRLSKEEHAGRRYFWFHQEELSQQWFEHHFAEVRAQAGARYTPELNVELPIAQVFDGLGRTERFFRRIRKLYGQVNRHWSRLKPRSEVELFATAAGEEFLILAQSVETLITVLSAVGEDPFEPVPLEKIIELSRRAVKATWACRHNLEKVAEEVKRKRTAAGEPDLPPRYTGQPEAFSSERHWLWELARNLNELVELAESDAAQLANRPALLLIGDAGIGKTHLFCDVAKDRIDQRLPTVLLLGQHFTRDEPWESIIKQLHLSCTRDELLGALDAAAQATGRRALILIDALNEGEGKHLWEDRLPAMLEVLRRYPRLGLAVSCRSSYEATIIRDDLVPEQVVRVEHPGFAEHEFIATRTFFDHYGIERPSVPLLVPEFQNPLFLKIFCEGLKNLGLARVPVGLKGITSIFAFFVDSVNRKLAAPDRLDFAERARVVQRAVNAVAELMATSGKGWVPWEEAQAVVDSILPRQGYRNSLFYNLISEGLLAEDNFYERNQNVWIESIRFPYERFADHIVAQYLLDKYLDTGHPETSFQPDKVLGAFIKDQHAAWASSGIVAALCIQLPERIGKELFEVAPCGDFWPVQEGFIHSLIWRAPEAIGDAAIKYLNQLASTSEELDNAILDAILTVCTNPDHPLNAEFLHRNLLGMSMPDRDAWWSIFLHHQYGKQKAVDRLLDWAWPPEGQDWVDHDRFDDEPGRLCVLALGWFLTTPNRFVRDRATKALVSLLHRRLHLLREVIEAFLEVDDLYVLERLYAVAYGCAMLSEDHEAVGLLAEDVYRWVFASGKPIPHLLLRDYARGVVEYALHLGCDLAIDVSKIRPPYQSEWPLPVPTLEELETQYQLKNYEIPLEKSYRLIWSSVGDWGDFARYIIGTNSGNSGIASWTARPLNAVNDTAAVDQSVQDTGGELEPDKDEDDEGEHALAEWYAMLSDEQLELLAVEVEDDGDDEERQAAISKLLDSLTEEQRQALLDGLASVRQPARRDDPMDHFDLGLAQRWIFKRVIDLGWTPERFDQFDRWLKYSDGRAAKKPERVGKKYQWIALHEFAARVADNFEYRKKSWDKVNHYEGPWQIYRRDIDPSLLMRTSGPEFDTSEPVVWWAPISYSFEKVSEVADIEWLRGLADCPDPLQLIEVTRPRDGSQWLTLEGYYFWEESAPVEEERFEKERRQIWYQVRSYFVDKEHEEEMLTWLKEQHFMGRWMPKSVHFTEGFIGEFPWAPFFAEYREDGWTFEYDEAHGNAWFIGGPPKTPLPVIVPCIQYLWEDGGFDCSIDDTVSGLLPAPWLVEQMNLKWARRRFRFVNTSGELVAYDPSAEEAGPTALLVSKPHLQAFLIENDLSIFWTVLGEKLLIGGALSTPDTWPGKLEIDGVYYLKDGNVTGTPLRAKFVTREGEEDVALE